MKKIMSRLSMGVVLGGCLAFGTAFATPTDFSFTGTFSQDDDVQLFNFSVGATSDVTLRSWSYAGGTNSEGTLIASGGFDPILALFSSDGTFIDSQDDAGDDGNSVPEDPDTGSAYDVNFTTTLDPGDYIVALTEYDNLHNGDLADGFERDGEGNFTGGSFGCGMPGTAFVDYDCNRRDSHWAFDILNVDLAATPPTGVPEPSALAFMGLGFVALGLMAKRRRRG